MRLAHAVGSAFALAGRVLTLVLLKIYRVGLSPVILTALGPACRFEPSCSAYAGAAVAQHGVARGGWMAIRRLLRCRPGGGWGYDPVVGEEREMIG